MSAGAYVSSGTAARLLGVTRPTVVRWVKAGTLEGIRQCSACEDGGCTHCRYYVYRGPLRRRLARAKGDAPHDGAREEKRDGKQED